MKLLWVVPYAPNPIRVRPYEFLRTLAGRGHEITLATLVTGPSEEADVEALRKLGIRVLEEDLTRLRTMWNAARTLPSNWPLQARWAESPALSQRIQKEVAALPWDAVHVEHLRGSAYALNIHDRIAKFGVDRRPRLIWDSVDSISLLFEQTAEQAASARARWMARIELDRTRRMEGRLVRTFDHTVVTAETDAAELRRLAGVDAPITVVPNGVDLTAFFPPDGGRAPARIVLSGKMSYHANVTAAVRLVREIMPAVWARRPDAEVHIAGANPSAEVRALAGDRVTVTGMVPSMAVELQQAAVAVAPIVYGVGIQNKVLEAMACATPVVASAQAADALGAVAGEEYLSADDDGQFAAALVSLLDDGALRERIGRSGRAYVERAHSWQASAAKLETLYAQVI